MLLSEKAQQIRTLFARSWMKRSEMLDDELLQANDEGRQLPEDIYEKAKKIKTIAEPMEKELEAAKFFKEIESLPYRTDFNYQEPSDYKSIRAASSASSSVLPAPDDGKRFDKVYGALLARCVGCLLGSPVEGWSAQKIQNFMEDVGNDPIHYYFRSDISQELREKYEISDDGFRYQRPITTWINNINYAPEDDDTNYTLLELLVLEEIGRDFSSQDCADNWLYHLPMFHTAVTERLVYQNLANGIKPPYSGSYANPYRETLGAQIRADIFGYICPGKPETAAEMAWRNASMTNAKNGIYGSMFVAAMLAAAQVVDSPKTVIRAGLEQIPTNSRLYEAIELVLDWHSKGLAIYDIFQKIDEFYTHYGFSKSSYAMCHVIPNIMIVVESLLYGNLDFDKTIGTAVMAGYDTDCNAATVGSISGMMLGSSRLPQKWIIPLNNQVQTCISGYDDKVLIDQVARRILAI